MVGCSARGPQQRCVCLCVSGGRPELKNRHQHPGGFAPHLLRTNDPACSFPPHMFMRPGRRSQRLVVLRYLNSEDLTAEVYFQLFL